MAGRQPLSQVGRVVVALAAVSLMALPAAAAGIAVLTKAEPGLSETGRAIWNCTYVAGMREFKVVRETTCPPSIPVP